MAVLTLEQYQTLRAKVIDVADANLVARSIISPLKVDWGTQEYGYDKLTDMTDAEILDKFAPGSRDEISLSRKTASVSILNKGFSINRVDLGHINTGQPIKAKALGRATRKVAELEDKVIFKGDSVFGIKGIDGIANNTYSCGLNWGTGTPDSSNNPYVDVLNAKTKLTEDGFDAEFLALDPINYGEAGKLVPNTSGTWLDMIKRIVPNVLQSAAITHGTFYMGDMGEDIAELVIAEDYELLDPNVAGQLVYNFNVVTRVLPMFYQYGSSDAKSDAFVKATGA